MKACRAFTLLELLVVIAIIAVLAVFCARQLASTREVAWKAVSVHSLRNLSAAGIAYCGEHDGEFWKYREDDRSSTQWWFGREEIGSQGAGEGERFVDFTRGPLGPYATVGTKIASDPAFLAAAPRHKPKFKNGNHGYGYNALLGGGAMGRAKLPRRQGFERPGEIVVFATCAQVNTFQPPASGSHPMIEEFYLIDDRETTVHFRYGERALTVMVDGSLRELKMDRTTLDSRMPSANIGRFAPVGSKLYLSE